MTTTFLQFGLVPAVHDQPRFIASRIALDLG
jgi:hypothetical protein